MNRLRLVLRAAIGGDSCQVGTLSEDANKLYFCADDDVDGN